MRILIQRGLPLEEKNGYGGTALGGALWAAFREPRADHLLIIEALLAAGAKVEPEWQADLEVPGGQLLSLRWFF